MKKTIIFKDFRVLNMRSVLPMLVCLMLSTIIEAQVVLESEIKISDIGLHFNGSQVRSGDNFNADNGNNNIYDYYFGKNISAHGDCIKTLGDYVFMTWYKGGKTERNVMLTRYNTVSGTSVTIEFPHTHTGFQNRWWIGESHNTIAVAVSPIDGTIHMLYDMHAYSRTRPSDGSLSKDYFRYSYSIKNAASVPDSEFTLDKFVQNSSGGYKHLSLNGGEDYANFSALTYPQFFLNDAGDIFMYMREGGNNNGAYKFSKYDANSSTWSNFTDFNVLNARSQPGIIYNWGLYGNMKYVNGKIRIGFQRRSQNNNDKYQYQNGVYYAYSDNQDGTNGWKNHSGESFALPLYDADFIKVMEPGDYVETTQKNKVYIVGDFDWTVTEKGDVHIISKVRDLENGVTKYLHTYKPSGASDFITSEEFSGGTSIYTSGDDVFIIGLKAGRVFVEKAIGGTNNFTTVYQATSGKIFDHGRVHINNGKLYYYLMENKSGNAMPLYLQIIDLDIVKDPFRVSITSPFNGQKFDFGETTTFSANAVNENGDITKVDFLLDGTLYQSDNTYPYEVDWNSNLAGNHTIQATAYDENDATVTSSEVMFSVKEEGDLSGTLYRIKNVATGKYLDSENTQVIASVSGDGEDKQWEFVKAEEFYNIDSNVRGVLRAAGSPEGAIINTSKAPPTTDSDKQWVIISETDGSYRFKARNGTRYLYNDVDDIIIYSSALDDRSKWLLESPTLGLSDKELVSNKVSVYPNPARNEFTIALNRASKADVVISDILGKVVYKTHTTGNTLKITNDGKFKAGMYIVRVLINGENLLNTKLIVN